MTRARWWPIVLVGLIVHLPAAPLGAQPQAQQLVRGNSSTFTVDYEIGDAAITDPQVCNYIVRDSRREVYLSANAAGTTMLTLWDRQGMQRDVVPIRVVSSDLQQIESRARQQVGDANLRFVQRGDAIVMEGEVGSAEALARAEALSAAEPQLKNALRIGPRALERLGAEVTRAIGRPGITARRVKDRLILEGVAYSADAAKYAEQIARLYAPQVVNLLEVRNTQRSPGDRPLVHLDLYFMEMKKSAVRRFGIEWTPGATGRSGSGGSGLGDLIGSALGFVTNLLPKLRLARERGDARILEHPYLVVKSGENGSLFSGSEVPYPSERGVQFKDVGIQIEAEPIASGQDVDLQIKVTVSALGSGTTPAIDRRTVATHAYCRSGESIVLGGLWNGGRATSRNRLPNGVDTSSALVTLALSKDFQSHQSDFLIFITPRLSTQAQRADEQLREFEHLREELTAAPAPRRHRRSGADFRRAGMRETAVAPTTSAPRPTRAATATPAALPMVAVPEALR